MKGSIRIGAAICCALLTLAMISGASGQEGGGRPQDAGMGHGMMPPHPPEQAEMQYAAGCLFLLQGETLTKFDAGTLKVTGACTLSGDAATQPAAGGEARKPLAAGPTLLLTSGADENAMLLVVAGGTFYRIQVSDLTLAVKKTLPVAQPAQTTPNVGNDAQDMRPGGPPPEDALRLDGGGDNGAADGGPGGAVGAGADMGAGGGPPDAGPDGGAPGGTGRPGGRGMQPPPARPTYLLHDNILYLLSGKQLLAIDTRTGEVQTQSISAGKAAVKPHE